MACLFRKAKLDCQIYNLILNENFVHYSKKKYYFYLVAKTAFPNK